MILGANGIAAFLVLLAQLAGLSVACFFTTFFVGYAMIRPRKADGNSCRRSQLRFAVQLIDDGFDYEPDWRTQMINAFDDRIEPYLTSLRAASERVVRHRRDEWGRLIDEELAAIYSDMDQVTRGRMS